jgi:DNA-binding MarR family transcriptional regulator
MIQPKRNSYHLGLILSSDIDDAGLDVYEFRVYAHLCRRVNDQMRCWGSQKNIAKICGFSVDTVARALKKLESRGWLTQEEKYRDDGSRTTNLITLIGAGGIPLQAGGDTALTGGGIPLKPRAEVNPIEVNPVLTPTLESERLGNSQPDLESASILDSNTSDLVVPFGEEKTVESDSIATTPTTDLGKKRGAATRAANAEAAGSAARAKLEQMEGFTVLWEKYEKVRSEKRQKLTPTARGEALEMLLDHPKPLEVIRYTVANGYTGLVFDKFRETKTTPNSVVEPEPQAPTAKGIPEGENSPGMYRTPHGQTIKVFNSYAGFVWLDESGDRSIPERETVGWRKVGGLT